ncbi:short-chain dehydrogenase [Paucibacter sp. KBW04]|uniref:SDR family NAD(P)-dependent oxidoreductase n=1 Tax=Paucibacter sp. KBW04 TaxID=2153361 RepID=UPI000F55E198|nr:SDR family NAD(P)-dependent oxidoreductase [Paucibacter sp. KBW04]RQO56269.1 short-chain dehydrogenase [Paucibacter sp. KBW04]
MSAPAKYALVTGAGSGIGRSIARLLAAEGWTLGLVDVDAKALRILCQELGSATLELPGDISAPESVAQVFDRFAELSGGHLDLLVNNAGLLYTGHFEDQSLEHLSRLLAVNNLGPALCCRAALPLLKRSVAAGRQPVSVVNLSSASSVFGIPSMAIYSASKFWVRGFTEALASEWARHGISVRAVVPPFVNTPMLEGSQKQVLLRRMGINLGPDEVAHEVLQAISHGPLHRPVSWRFKALLLIAKILPACLMRRGLLWMSGYPASATKPPSP